MFKRSLRSLLREQTASQRRYFTGRLQGLKSGNGPRSPHLAIKAVAFGTLGTAVLTVGFFYPWQIHAESAVSEDSSRGLRQRQKATVSLEDMPTISYDLSEENLSQAKEEFIRILGPDRLSTDLGSRIAHSSTAWSEAPNGDLDRPAFILFPKSTEEVSEIAKICHRRRIPIIGYSGGTSLEGTLAAIHGGVSVDFKLMNRVIALHKDDVDVVVQPAVGYEELNELLARDGLFFPPDPGPGAKIGGMIGQGCSGTNAYRYGTVKDWVLGLTVVLADGTVVKTRGRARKSSSGYNLTQLMVGSEGTLGLITEASLKVTARPRHERVAVAAFPSLQAAVATAVAVVRSGMPVGAMEMLDGVAMRAVNQGGYCDKQYDEVPHLFFKFAGASPGDVAEQISRVRALAEDPSGVMGPSSSSSSSSSSSLSSLSSLSSSSLPLRKSSRSDHGCTSFEASESEAEAAAIWEARKTVLFAAMSLKADPSDEFLSSDTAVPIGRLADAIEAAKRVTGGDSGDGSGDGGDGSNCSDSGDGGMISFYVGHLGDGNFHTGVLYAARARDRARARAAIRAIQRHAIRLDGTVTGEHGIGLEYREMVVEELGGAAVDAMRAVKLALDPHCILNPDKIFRLKIESKR